MDSFKPIGKTSLIRAKSARSPFAAPPISGEKKIWPAFPRPPANSASKTAGA